MFRISKSLSTALSLLLFLALGAESVLAGWTFTPARARVQEPPRPQPVGEEQSEKEGKEQSTKERPAKDKAKKRERKREKRQQNPAPTQGPATAAEPRPEEPANGGRRRRPPAGQEVEIVSDSQARNGDVLAAEGYVNVTIGDMRLQADRVTFNEVTGDMVAEGNVIFDEGADQRVTARRAEINWTSRRGTFWNTTGFTNRTQTGEYIFFTAERVERTGEETYNLFNATVTACEDVVPKWSFSSKRAELKLDDRIKLYNSVFRIKSFPAFVLPFAWIPATQSERKSGFLLPTTGTSNQKGRTFKTAYYQTLGQSADITFRSDTYSSRGLGFGAEFRAQTDERSFMRLGFFTVKDRLFGEEGENQGGTAFVGEGVQYLPHGWLAVGNVSLVTSLRFRQVFSDDISQIIDPRRESTFYVNNNAGSFSFNFLASNETTTLFRPATDPEASPVDGTNFDVKIRRAPEINLNLYPRRIFDSLPIYFSFETAVGALKREETVDSQIVLITASAVQRFDFQPRITVPLATIAGVAITPGLTLRETFYTSRLDSGVETFDPDRFTLSATDPRLDPAREEFKPGLQLFDRTTFDSVVAENLSRRYAELAVDVRPPTLEKLFLNEDGSRRFKHVIEPYLTYRLIRGVGEEFDETIKFDERDAVANTNEIEYAVVNRFFNTRRASELVRRRRNRDRVDDEPSEMEPVSPGKEDRRRRKRDKKNQADQIEDQAAPEKSGPAQNRPEQDKQEQDKPEKDKQDKPEQADPAPVDRPAPGPEPVESQEKTSSADADRKMKLETGKSAELGKGATTRKAQRKNTDQESEQDEDPGDPAAGPASVDSPDADDLDSATNENSPGQAYEFLSIKLAQKYFFDRDFGGALQEGERNQFYPINTLSGFTYGGRARGFSPVNVQVRYRPLSSVFADLRMDIGSDDKAVRNVTVTGGVSRDRVSVSTSWYLSRRINLDGNRFEPGTFPGNQIVTTVQFGDADRGFYGGTRIGYDFTNRFIADNSVSTGRLRNSRSYVGYQFDCCGVQFNYNTFKAGLRNESAFSFTFTLAGLGSFGTDQFSQLGGGRGGRKRGKRARREIDDDF